MEEPARRQPEPARARCPDDAFGNAHRLRPSGKQIPKSELRKIKIKVAVARRRGEECHTDEEIEAAGYAVPLDENATHPPPVEAANVRPRSRAGSEPRIILVGKAAAA